MKLHFKAPLGFFDAVRNDVRRPHPFAAERVGFVIAGAAAAGPDVLLLARGYLPVEDGDYIVDPRVGAMIGPGGMRKALQEAYRTRSGLFHIHMHEHRGPPSFSSIDRRESNRFVPSFFNASPKVPHGVLLLSADAARGLVWLAPQGSPRDLDSITWPGLPRRGVLA